MTEKRFEKLGMPDIERFENYLPTAFNSELTLLQKVNKIIFDLIETNKLTNEMVDYLNEFVDTFDEKLYETLEDVLNVWLDDGRLSEVVAQIIGQINDFKNEVNNVINNQNTSINNKFILQDKSISDFKEKTTKDLHNILYDVSTGDILPDVEFVNTKLADLLSQGYRKFYFPKGKYLFTTNVPNFKNSEIYGDDITFSFVNNSQAYSFKDVIFKNTVTIETRDRLGNESKIYSNIFNQEVNASFVEPSALATNHKIVSLVSKVYSPDLGLIASDIFSKIGDEYKINPLKKGEFGCLLYPISDSESLTSTMYGVPDLTELHKFGLIVSDDDGKNFIFFSLRTDNRTMRIEENKNSKYSVKEVISPKHFERYRGSSLYWNSALHYQLKIRRIDKHKVSIYFNDLEIMTYKTDFEIKHCGFVSYNAPETFAITYPIVYKSNREPINHSLKIGYFGDSIGNGDGSLTFPYLDIKKSLEGRLGITNVEIRNVSTGGYRLSQILTAIKDSPTSDLDVIVVQGGTNDITNGTGWASFIDTYGEIIEYARDISARVVCVSVPPMTSKGDTGMGANFNSGNKSIGFTSLNNIIVARNRKNYQDISSAVNMVGNTSSNKFEYEGWNQDNIHLTNLGSKMLSQSIVSAILELYSPSL